MRILYFVLFTSLLASSCSNSDKKPRVTEDFNYDWKFYLGDEPDAFNPEYDDSDWRLLNLPHDWSIEEGYQNIEGTAASTGFVPGGIGWYRKSFKLKEEDQGKHIRIVFDGIYNNSSVWINGHFLGKRPYGYSTFVYDLTEYLNFGESENVIAVHVDRKAYADCRWYTGSGIYRKVQLIKTLPLHIAQWGVQITTPEITSEEAEVRINTSLENPGSASTNGLLIRYSISDQDGSIVTRQEVKVDDKNGLAASSSMLVRNPELWSLEKPNLYSLDVELLQNGKLLDRTSEIFGIRTIEFNANTGFSLNGKNMKFKGVNLHHDAGAVGAAVPKGIWEYRVKKLKSIGVNAIRFSHNPHSVELLEICDELGMLVINEAFDEWDRPKGKNLDYIGDNAAPEEATRGYAEFFNEWGERDLKDLILRDFNHPSVIMWSIGNEIEWTFPYYFRTYTEMKKAGEGKGNDLPIYNSPIITKTLNRYSGGADTLVIIAEKLSQWVKEMDTTRPVTTGSVISSIGLESGYADQTDVLGLNYAPDEYDAIHEAYPDLIFYGSENHVAWLEWDSAVDRDFVGGIFVWTGFAYLGEAGPWPRKGLNISLFDFAGFKNPRGHFFECLWKENPKVYMVTTPADESEFSYNQEEGWKFTMQMTKPPAWDRLRLWEWYKVYPKWNYSEGESIIVQTYTNCEEAELFLNGESLGKQKRSEFSGDNIIKWLVPYRAGELKVVGHNDGKEVTEYILNSTGKLSKIAIHSNKKELSADGYDVAVISVELLDENDNLITDSDQVIEFTVSGPANNIGIDNGWEYNVQSHKSNTIKTHQGKAILIVQSIREGGAINVSTSCGDISSESLNIVSK